jgi:NAD(P)-dependent dehydrogenase (short-subunit alcohol dehydrogenase family)
VRQAAAVVTGAGGGLGRAIARRLGKEGWGVVVNDIDGDAALAVASAIEQDGGRALAVAADATDAVAVLEMVAAARQRLGPVLVTVANATGPQGTVSVDDLSWEYVLGHLEFFAKSPLLLLQATLPDMRAAGWGRVVHIGSDMFDGGAPGWSAYMAAKGALVGLTRGWAMELGRDGITVNLVAPGWIPVERHGVIPADIEQERLARQCVPRWGKPDDIADAVAYLVTDGAGFISGQRLVVNGGIQFG